MRAGSWASIGLIYLYGVLGSASLSKIIPLQADLVEHLGASTVQFAFLISLLTIPPALFATIGGSIIDRVGARATLIAAALAGALANFLYLQAESILAFQGVRIFEGCILIGVYSAAPALIMATASPERRGRAMAFWSTYTPVGVSVGLVMSGSFAGTEHWRGSYAIHCGLFLIMALLGLLLPKPARNMAAPWQPRGLLATYADLPTLRLALTLGVLVIMGFGTSTVFPRWYAQQHAVSIGTASSILAIANLAMVPGSMLTGFLIGRGFQPSRVLTGLAVFSIAACIAIFVPGTTSLLCLAGLGVWLATSGAATAVITSSLPRILSNPSLGASAAGLLSQIAALCTFVTPQLWLPALASGRWPVFILIVAACWTAALGLLPVRTR